jgi:hypothetical protein
MTSAPPEPSTAPPASRHELRRVFIAVTLLFVLVGGFVFAVARYRLVCLAVPCDLYLTVRGTIVTPEGTPVDGCTLTAAEAPEANVLPGVSPSGPLEALEVPATFEEGLLLSPFADRYILQIVDCPGGATSRTIPLDLADVDPTPHDLGRIVVVTRRP